MKKQIVGGELSDLSKSDDRLEICDRGIENLSEVPKMFFCFSESCNAYKAYFKVKVALREDDLLIRNFKEFKDLYGSGRLNQYGIGFFYDDWLDDNVINDEDIDYTKVKQFEGLKGKEQKWILINSSYRYVSQINGRPWYLFDRDMNIIELAVHYQRIKQGLWKKRRMVDVFKAEEDSGVIHLDVNLCQLTEQNRWIDLAW